MKNIWDNSWFMIPALLFFNIGLLLLYFVPYGYEILYLNDFRYEPFNSIFQCVTLLGEVYAYIICGVAALFWRYRFALLIALVGLITLPTVFAIKKYFSIDRPITFFRQQALEHVVVTVPGVALNSGPTSFPSGHTMAAFALYGIVTLILGQKQRRWGLALSLLAALVGVSRVFLVQHFLVDILVGAVLGLGVTWLVWRFDQTSFFQNMKWLDGRFSLNRSVPEV